jgi:hypothetical protein
METIKEPIHPRRLEKNANITFRIAAAPTCGFHMLGAERPNATNNRLVSSSHSASRENSSLRAEELDSQEADELHYKHHGYRKRNHGERGPSQYVVKTSIL